MLEASLWWAPVVSMGTAVLVNATNFMDGANGLACGHAVATSLWYVLVATVAPLPGLGLVMISVAGASLWFLPEPGCSWAIQDHTHWVGRGPSR